jgi:hypothetical protein
MLFYFSRYMDMVNIYRTDSCTVTPKNDTMSDEHSYIITFLLIPASGVCSVVCADKSQVLTSLNKA